MKNVLIPIFLSLVYVLNGQNVSGTITDTLGKPIFAVNVYCVNNLELGTTSDFSGHFSLNLTSETCDTLVFSYLGYETKYMPLVHAKRTDLLVELSAASALLEGVEINASPNVTQEFSVMKNARLIFRL